MSFAPISDERLREIAETVSKSPSRPAAATALGLSESTIRHHLRTAARRGLLGFAPVLEGFEVSKVSTDPKGRSYVSQKPERGGAFEVPAGHSIKGISALVDGDGRTVQQWVKTRGEPDPLALADAIKAAFADYKYPAQALPAPDIKYEDILAFLPISDMHMGMRAWGRSVGADWDLNIAVKTFGAKWRQLMAQCVPAKQAVMLWGGDVFHSNNNKGETDAGTPLDMDGRYDAIVEKTCFLAVEFVDVALQRFEHITIRVLKGNHDPDSSVALVYFLLAHYRNEPRVTVDCDPSYFWAFQFGKTMHFAHHGHKLKPKRAPITMAVDYPQMWADCPHRFASFFHVHHSSRLHEDGSVDVRTWQAPVASDEWHHGQGYRAGRSFHAVFFDREEGYRGECAVQLSPREQRKAA